MPHSCRPPTSAGRIEAASSVAILTENDVVNGLPQRKIASWSHRGPVSAPNSLLTRQLIGNLADSGLALRFRRLVSG
jgi:hypothetical protein